MAENTTNGTTHLKTYANLKETVLTIKNNKVGPFETFAEAKEALDKIPNRSERLAVARSRFPGGAWRYWLTDGYAGAHQFLARSCGSEAEFPLKAEKQDAPVPTLAETLAKVATMNQAEREAELAKLPAEVRQALASVFGATAPTPAQADELAKLKAEHEELLKQRETAPTATPAGGGRKRG